MLGWSSLKDILGYFDLAFGFFASATERVYRLEDLVIKDGVVVRMALLSLHRVALSLRGSGI